MDNIREKYLKTTSASECIQVNLLLKSHKNIEVKLIFQTPSRIATANFLQRCMYCIHEQLRDQINNSIQVKADLGRGCTVRVSLQYIYKY